MPNSVMLPEHLIPDCINTHGPRKSSFNQKERKAIRLFLTLRDGNICKICNLPAADGELLDIDHIDGDKENPHHTNLQQAHHKCNCKKNKKGWNKKGMDSLCVSVEENSKLTVNYGELFFKLKYHRAFLEYIERKFRTEGVKIIDIKDMARNLHYATNGSTETFKRYARDLCGTETPYELQISADKKTEYLSIKPDQDIEKLMINKYAKD